MLACAHMSLRVSVQMAGDETNGYKAKQVSLLYVFVNIFGLDHAQTTIDFEMCWSN